jgi:hypothetical protein
VIGLQGTTTTEDDDIVDWVRHAGLQQLATSSRLALYRV